MHELSTRQRGALLLAAAVLWAGAVKLTGHDLFPFPWLVSAVLLGGAVCYALRMIDES